MSDYQRWGWLPCQNAIEKIYWHYPKINKSGYIRSTSSEVAQWKSSHVIALTIYIVSNVEFTKHYVRANSELNSVVIESALHQYS